MNHKYPVSKFVKDNDMLHLYVKDVRVLTVPEYENLLLNINQKKHKTLFELSVICGMRFIEIHRLYQHPEWYNEKRNIIHLPEEASLKVKRKQLMRTIHPLPSEFKYIFENFKENKPPTLASWNKVLQRAAIKAGISPFGISAKTSRKTMESWMIVGGIPVNDVCLRQGHDSLTSMRHYQGLVFNDDELRDIKNKLRDWKLLV